MSENVVRFQKKKRRGSSQSNSPHRIRSFVLRMLLVLFSALAAIVLAFVIYINASPNLLVWYIRQNPTFNVQPTAPDAIWQTASLVQVRKDISYAETYPNSTLDVYTSAGSSGRRPTIFWLHGGGYVGGDKSSLWVLADRLAADGYTVITVNYALAPQTSYPAPVIQMQQAYQYVKSHPQQFAMADLNQTAFGGDSAGAQIMSQFLAVQTNRALASEMGLRAVVPAASLKGAVLYCGTYRMASFLHVENQAEKFFIQQLGWAYFGRKDWEADPASRQTSTYDQVTKDFPATFLTDGNSGSFENDAKQLQSKLKSLGVSVSTLFYPEKEITLPHEYQFNYQDYPAQANECYSRTAAFLRNCFR